MNDIMIVFQKLLLIFIHFEFSTKIADIKTAFLTGDFEEEIYMECPKSMKDIGKDDCIVFDKFTYGLLKATSEYYTKVKILKK